MPDYYTHPNGHTITHRDGGVVRIESDAGEQTYLGKDETAALRDFLLADLGLWRDDETGALVMTGSWDSSGAYVLPVEGRPVYGLCTTNIADLADAVVTRWRATLTPPPREPKPGEVWRITLADGSECNAVVGDGRFRVSCIPTDRRRLLVEADGTVVSDE